MLYQRIYGTGYEELRHEAFDPAEEHARLTRESRLPRFPWRPALLQQPGVERIGLIPELHDQCLAVGTEPIEQMFAYFGIQHQATFFALQPFPISGHATSRLVQEQGVSEGRSQVTSLFMRLLSVAVPEARCIIVHNHPFTEQRKLHRLGFSTDEINRLQDDAQTRLDLGLYPWLHGLPRERQPSAALNELVASQLSAEDLAFTGPGYQLLTWENPVTQSARFAAFRIDAAFRTWELEDVFCSPSLPTPVLQAQDTWRQIGAAISYGIMGIDATRSETKNWKDSPLSYEDEVHRQLCLRFGAHLQDLARDCISSGEFNALVDKHNGGTPNQTALAGDFSGSLEHEAS